MEEEQVHYIITDGYSKKIGYIHYQNYPLFGKAPSTVENNNQFSCTDGEYLTNQIITDKIDDKIRTVTYEYKCSSGGPRPIPASNVGATGPIGPRGWIGVPGGIGAQGKQGVPGSRGAIGPTGSRGAIGVAGEIGSRGMTGDIGNMGIQGNTGIKGNTGQQGIQGAAPQNKSVQLNITTVLLFLIIVYVVVYVSSLSTILGTSGNVVGDAVTKGGGMFGDMIANSGETVGSMVSGSTRMVGGVIGGASDILGGF
jgi:hypothetical protein